MEKVSAAARELALQLGLGVIVVGLLFKAMRESVCTCVCVCVLEWRGL